MGNIMWGIVFLLAGVVLVWLGIRQRKRAQRDYEDDVRRYTASTVMTVVHLDESVLETWEDRDDGGRELRRETVYQPTYEYTVDGKTYRYASRQCVSSRDMGRQVTGYYDPADPSCITENRPRKPILGGFFFFAFAAFLLFLPIGPLRESFTFPEYIEKRGAVHRTAPLFAVRRWLSPGARSCRGRPTHGSAGA